MSSRSRLWASFSSARRCDTMEREGGTRSIGIFPASYSDVRGIVRRGIGTFFSTGRARTARGNETIARRRPQRRQRWRWRKRTRAYVASETPGRRARVLRGRSGTEPEKQPVRLLWPQNGCPSHESQRSRTLRSVRLDVARTLSEQVPRLSAIGTTSSRGVYSPASSESRSIHDSQLVGSLSRRSATAVGNEIVTDCRCRMPGRCSRIIRSIAEVILRGYSLP